MLNQISIKSKRIFILGAGSSISHDNSFPSITDFFSKAKELGIDIKKGFPSLHKYIYDNLGIDVTFRNNKANVETIFTHLEIDLERSQDTSLALIRDQLLKLIQSILTELADRIKTVEGDLHKFADLLSPSDTILNFNWDILIDNILNREKFLRRIYQNEDTTIIHNSYFKFLCKLSLWGRNLMDEIGLRQPYSSWNNADGYYLKLHGSIDWVFCNNELCRGFGEGIPIEKIHEKYYCSSCHESMYPLLIPPVLNKQYRKYHLIRRIWNTALKEIEDVTDLIIWGYSLPDTDFYSAWLFKNARQSIKTLTLINPSVIKGKKEKKINKVFVNHFVNIFKGRLKKDSINLYEKFEDYLTNLNVHKKYGIKQILT